MKTLPHALLAGLLPMLAGRAEPAPAAPAQDPGASELQRKLEPALAKLVERHRLPGLALGLVRDGKVVYAAAIGETWRGSGQALTTRSIFHLASVSKTFTATAALQLVEAGKLELDAPLSKYLPYFRLAEESSRAITVRQVLTHTSGFPDVHDYHWDAPESDAGAAERYVRSLSGEQLLFAPGTGWSYSNMAFDTLGDVIAKAAGQSFDDYERTHIFLPLGMKTSSFIPAETPAELRTRGHSSFYGTRVDLAPSPVQPYNRRHAPSSTLNSNVEDMCRWMLANLAQGELDGARILTPENHARLWTKAHDAPALGLAWFLEDFGGRRLVQHSGADVGYRSYLALLPDQDLGVIVLAQADNAPVESVARAALHAALGEPFELAMRPKLCFEFAHLLENGGFERAAERYFELQETEPTGWIFGVLELDRVAEDLLAKARASEAAEVAALNADLYPETSSVFARLGDALAAQGDTAGARAQYEHALELAPNDAAARAGLKSLAP